MHETLTQKEFTDKYNAGQREFKDVLMQFFDISGMKMSDLTIKNSKIMFCNFHNCELKNLKIDNCTIFFLSFYTGSANEILFDKCDIEQMLFDTFSFGRTKFSSCNIRWSAILNSNSSVVDMVSSSQYKFFTDLSQVTAQDIENAVKIIGHDIERLDLGTRMKVKEMIRQDIDRFHLPDSSKKNKGYANKSQKYDDTPLTYNEIKDMVETAYGARDTYKTKKSAYDADRAYK